MDKDYEYSLKEITVSEQTYEKSSTLLTEKCKLKLDPILTPTKLAKIKNNKVQCW